MELNISPPIWQLYINAILSCLQSRKYCEAIMYNLLLFTLTKSFHFEKARRFIESFTQKWTEDFPKEMSIIQD